MPLTYDDIPGSWGPQSVGWPSTPYTMGKWLLCTKAKVVPYGSYVHVGDVIRVETDEYRRRLDLAYQGMFVDCRNLLLKEEFSVDARS